MYNYFSLYKKIYDLETVRLKNVKEGTINFIFFDENLNYYLLNDGKLLSYSLNLNINIIDVIDNLEQTYNIKIMNFFPVCFVNKSSIIFACKIYVNKNKYIKKIYNHNKFNDIINMINRKAKYYSKEFDDETVITERYHNRYDIYNKYIKKFFITEKARRKSDFLKTIESLIGQADSIIDISCGDNSDIYKIFNKSKFLISNDISLCQLKTLRKRCDGVLFTNDNLLEFSFKKNLFSVSYCRNTLHHMENDEEIRVLLNSMYNISKKLVIVEIEDPYVVGGIPRFLNKYLYVGFLKDAGELFLDFKKFKNIIDDNFNNKCNVSYFSFKNILGNYMIAVVEKR